MFVLLQAVGGVAILAPERHKLILQVLKEKGSITVQEASELLRVSSVTVRKDIDFLDFRGLVVRARGGATLKGVGTSFEPLYYEKRNRCREAKVAIGRAAAARVQDGQTIILDSGSTSFEMVPVLKERSGLTVVTYDLMIAIELSTNSEVEVIVPGGVVRNNLFSLRGTSTLEALKRIHVNTTFLTADAIDIEYGISNATLEGAAIKQAIVNAADEVVLIADHTKFGLRALAHVADLESVHHVITDDGIPGETLSELKAREVAVTVVGAKG